MKFILLPLIFTLASCSVFNSLTSQTYIKPHERFVLGNNKHGSFKANVKNSSKNDLYIIQLPIDGGSHSPVVLHPNESIRLKVDRNTAISIENQFDEQATVDLLVKGDTGLSMGYQQ
ncbi:MAG: hypothetical protein CFE24_15460 [Flavobacterium sp. BFFFF2]|nr:MAG: hypothetical protein CFE24_15460 [Flavobacterium sp. BFFFF2]